jgi:hypothetical protein
MRIAPLAFVVALALAAPANAGSASPGGTYAGWIPQAGGGAANDDPIVVRTDATGTVVTSVVMAFRPTCTDGRSFAFHREIPVRMDDGPGAELVPLRNAGGRFRLRLQAESASDDYGFTESGIVAGRLTRKGGRGTVAVSVAVFDLTTGAPVMTCQTNTMRFRVTRRLGRSYGGTSSQGEPVVMFLSPNRRTVREIGFDLNSECLPAGFVDYPDWVTRFAIRGGRFGDRFSYTDKQGNRSKYRITGRVGLRRATGTLRLTLLTAGGQVCRPAPIRFSLTSG